MFFPGRLDWNQLHELLLLVRDASFFEGIKIMGRLGFDAMLVLQAGGLALALPLGIITYFSAIRLFVHLQMKKQRKHLLNLRAETTESSRSSKKMRNAADEHSLLTYGAVQ